MIFFRQNCWQNFCLPFYILLKDYLYLKKKKSWLPLVSNFIYFLVQSSLNSKENKTKPPSPHPLWKFKYLTLKLLGRDGGGIWPYFKIWMLKIYQMQIFFFLCIFSLKNSSEVQLKTSAKNSTVLKEKGNPPVLLCKTTNIFNCTLP